MRRFVLYHGRRHPAELGEAEVATFLSSLAEGARVSAATRNQAASALLFLYRQVLGQRMGWIDGVVRAKTPRRLPVVLTRDEVKAVLAHLRRTPRLVVTILYGSGLRLLECLRLRVKDLDFGRGEILVRQAKGGRDRVTMLPVSVKPELSAPVNCSRFRRVLMAGDALANARSREPQAARAIARPNLSTV